MTNRRSSTARGRSIKSGLCLLVALLISLAPMPIAANSAPARHHPVRVTVFEQCREELDYTTIGDIHCLADAQGRAEILLDLAYRKALADLPPRKRTALELSQKKWLNRIMIDCDNDPKVKENRGGTLAHVLYNECYLAKTKARTKELKRHYPWVTR